MHANVHHVVRRQTVELGLRDQGGAHDLQEAVRQAVHDRLLAVMDEVFSSLAGGEELIQLDRVEIDLGALSPANLSAELVERSRLRLHEVLSGEIRALRGGQGPSPRGRILPTGESRLERLRVFLLTGALPPWAVMTAAAEMDAILREPLESDSAAVVDLFRSIATPRVMARVVKQFSPALRTGLLVALAGSRAAAIQQAWADWMALLSTEAAHPGQATAWAADAGIIQMETTVLEHAAAGSAQDDTAEVLTGQLLERLAAARGVPVPVLRSDLAAAARRILPSESGVRMTLGRLAGSPGPGDPPETIIEPEAWARGHPDRDCRDSTAGHRTVDARTSAEPPVPTDRRRGPEAPPEKDRTPAPGPGPTLESRHRLVGETSPHREGPPTADSAPPADRAGVAGPTPPELAPRREDTRATPPRDEAPDLDEAGQYVDDAGLVLLWPYLVRFFESVGLVEERAFRSGAARERAVLLLRHLVTGETAWPEPVLVLEKVLCGWAPEEPVARSIEVSEAETRESLELIESVIAHWTALKRTSVAGLRAAFLQREGHLARVDQGWTLRVARAGHDVLLDQLPWGIGFVRLPWMEQPLFVEW